MVKARFLSLLRAWIGYQRMLARRLFDPYRPEQYYMRGPGPRWHQKHDHPQA
jgi:hypothetical protein